MTPINKLLSIALPEEGYLEKASNKDLDDKTANVGKGDYTKYARDIDAISGFYNGPKQGFAWCDVFADWCFIQAFGVEEAKRLLCQPSKSSGAGCYYSANYFRNKGQYYRNNPKVGDQIFFGKYQGEGHVGIVYKVDDKYVYTIEGNTTSEAGMAPNGGATRRKRYSLTYSNISGYGRPDYSDTTFDVVLLKGDTCPEVKELQQLLIDWNYEITLSGIFDEATEKAVIDFQAAQNLSEYLYVGPSTWECLRDKPEPEKESFWKRVINLIIDFIKKLFDKDPKEPEEPEEPEVIFEPYDVIIIADLGLNVRSGPGTDYSKVGAIQKGKTLTIVEQSEDGEWGKIESPSGWVCLMYTEKI